FRRGERLALPEHLKLVNLGHDNLKWQTVPSLGQLGRLLGASPDNGGGVVLEQERLRVAALDDTVLADAADKAGPLAFGLQHRRFLGKRPFQRLALAIDVTNEPLRLRDFRGGVNVGLQAVAEKHERLSVVRGKEPDEVRPSGRSSDYKDAESQQIALHGTLLPSEDAKRS